MKLDREAIERAMVIDAVTQKQAPEKQREKMAKCRYLAMRYPDISGEGGSKEARQEHISQALERIERQYGQDEAQQAAELLWQKMNNPGLLRFILDYFERAGLNKADYKNKKIPRFFALGEKTWERLYRCEVDTVNEKNLWRIAVGLKLSEKEAHEMMDVARSGKTEFDCIMLLCMRLAESDKRYLTPEKVNELLTSWFGDDKKEHQLYDTEMYPETI